MKKIPLVDQEALERFVKDAKEELEYLRNKKRKTRPDFLSMEYLRTFINNPTPVNYILLSCGRADEMKRKEEETDEQ